MSKKVIRLNESEMESLIKKTVERALNEGKNVNENFQPTPAPVAEEEINEDLNPDQVAGLLGGATAFLGMVGLSAAQIKQYYDNFKKNNPNATSKQCLKAAWKKMGQSVNQQL